jgi:hypothetical protein
VEIGGITDIFGVTTPDKITCGICHGEQFCIKLSLDSIILLCVKCGAEARLRPELALAYWSSCWQPRKVIRSE